MSRILKLYAALIKKFDLLKKSFSGCCFFLSEDVLCIHRRLSPPIFLRTFPFYSFFSFNFLPEIKQYFSSLFLYSEIRVDGFNKFMSFYIGNLKRIKISSVFLFRLGKSTMSSKIFVNQLDRFWLCLFKRAFFIIAWACAASIFRPAFYHRKTAIAIHNSSNVGEINFPHIVDYTLFREKSK